MTGADKWPVSQGSLPGLRSSPQVLGRTKVFPSVRASPLHSPRWAAKKRLSWTRTGRKLRKGRRVSPLPVSEGPDSPPGASGRAVGAGPRDGGQGAPGASPRRRPAPALGPASAALSASARGPEALSRPPGFSRPSPFARAVSRSPHPAPGGHRPSPAPRCSAAVTRSSCRAPPPPPPALPGDGGDARPGRRPGRARREGAAGTAGPEAEGEGDTRPGA